jgi:hypothetical protein
MFRQDFTCPALLLKVFILRIRDYHPLWCTFPGTSPCFRPGLVRVRSPLLTESQLMSFPPGTQMFQFPGFAF